MERGTERESERVPVLGWERESERVPVLGWEMESGQVSGWHNLPVSRPRLRRRPKLPLNKHLLVCSLTFLPPQDHLSLFSSTFKP